MPPDNHNEISNGAYVQIERLDGRINTLVSVLEEREKRVHEAFAAAGKAGDKAEHAQHLINVVSNEWRGAMKDAQDKFANNVELERLTDRVAALEGTLSTKVGRTLGMHSAGDIVFRTLPMLLAVVSVVVSFLMYLELRA